MSKRTHFTTVTPLPAGISRETVLATLHSHTEMIDLNPLVTDRHPIRPPPCASPEESQCQWYSVTDKIAYLPAGLYTGSLTFFACFHDLEDGLQTRIVAPMGLDMRGRWTVGGFLPGEIIKKQEIGIGMPKTGLWLREDVDMKVNIVMTSFVKKTTKKTHETLVERLIEKSHLKEADSYNNALSEQIQLRESIPPDYHSNVLSPSGSSTTGGFGPTPSTPGYDNRESQYSFTGSDRASLRSSQAGSAHRHSGSVGSTYNNSNVPGGSTTVSDSPYHVPPLRPHSSQQQQHNAPAYHQPSNEYPPDHKYLYSPIANNPYAQQYQDNLHDPSLYPPPLTQAQQQQHPALRPHPHVQTSGSYTGGQQTAPYPYDQQRQQQYHHQQHQQHHAPAPLYTPPSGHHPHQTSGAPAGGAFIELPSQDAKTPIELDGRRF